MSLLEGHGPAIQLAAVLVEERRRAGLSRRALAESASVHQSYLSRLERGAYPHEVRPSTLERLSEVLGCGDRLFQAAGIASPSAIKLLAPLGRAHARAGEVQVRLSLRGLELAGIAAEFETLSLSHDGSRIDTTRLCRQVARSCAAEVRLAYGHDEREAASRRFWEAHAAAHTLLGSSCRWPYVMASEVEANSLASMLIAPARLVTAAIRSAALPAQQAIWTPACADLVRAVADRLVIPGWVALRRAGDAELDYFLPPSEES